MHACMPSPQTCLYISDPMSFWSILMHKHNLLSLVAGNNVENTTNPFM